MARYLCGPSVLRLEGRPQAVIPGEPFEHVFKPGAEAMALASGAIARLDAADVVEAEQRTAGYLPPLEDAPGEAVEEQETSAPAEPAPGGKGRRARRVKE